ncbi:L,D-transpeptidase family protein [Calidifontibacillus erzurumensis]|uniref:L,D-transpeptidase family protein n=1 Tax=Calidifontibacillus erzurumensis TaxID=2741433 RepID=UPI0035B50462
MTSKKRTTICSFFLFLYFFIPFSISVAAQEETKEEMRIKVDLWTQQLFLLKGEEIIKMYKIAPGTEELPTPIGTFTITEKSKDWGGGFGTRWLGLDVPWGTYGIHGTNKPWLIGKNVSSGCIRMLNKDVEELYDLVDEGVVVEIDGPITGFGKGEFKNLSLGSKGNLVLLVQQRLKLMNYYHGEVHGIFDKETERAVKSLQAAHQLPTTGGITEREYLLLGILE